MMCSPDFEDFAPKPEQPGELTNPLNLSIREDGCKCQSSQVPPKGCECAVDTFGAMAADMKTES